MCLFSHATHASQMEKHIDQTFIKSIYLLSFDKEFAFNFV